MCRRVGLQENRRPTAGMECDAVAAGRYRNHRLQCRNSLVGGADDELCRNPIRPRSALRKKLPCATTWTPGVRPDNTSTYSPDCPPSRTSRSVNCDGVSGFDRYTNERSATFWTDAFGT